HCIVMHVPPPRGGTSPTVYLKTMRGGQAVQPGAAVDIRWISDDDVGVSNVDIQLSTDGGATWPVTIAAATADDGQQTWTAPNIYSRRARLRITARDASG